MGNYRFTLSDMIPNAWFYKLKDMSRSRKQCSSHSLKKKPPSPTATSQKPKISRSRYSYYFTAEPGRADKFYNSPVNPKASDTHFPDPPRKSSKKRSKRKTIYKPSPRIVSSSFSAGCVCHETLSSVRTKSIPAYSPDYSSSPVESSSEPEFHESLLSEFEEDADFFAHDSFDHKVASCKVRSSNSDIIIDIDDEYFKRKTSKVDELDTIPELDLPPIVTRPAKFTDETTQVNNFKRSSSKLEEVKAHGSLPVKIVKEERIRTRKEQKAGPLSWKSSSNSLGIRLKARSPKIAGRKIQFQARKSVSSSSKSRTLSESFAVVKSSVDPQRDFRDSMVEMIVENNIRASGDLEDLLACYLSLNSKEYHDLIVKAFEQIWFELTDLRL